MNGQINVQVENLSKKFGRFTAVDKVTFSVAEGEIFGFLGANGAGKTTTIRMLCGLLQPSSGKGTVAGFDVYKEGEKIKKNIGYMSQKFSLYPDLSARENIIFYGNLYGLSFKDIEKRISVLEKDLHFGPFLNYLTADLPLGQKQIIALLSAIIHRPAILFLDEPTSGVDPISRRNFWKIIRQFADEGTTVFVTTHFMDEAEYCDRISIMHQGKIIAMDTPDKLKAATGAESIQSLFIQLVKDKI